MKTLRIILPILLLAGVFSAQAQELLTNKEVISLTKIGLDKDVIISKINSSDVEFDVTTDGLIGLGSESVDPDVIQAMMKRQEEVSAAKAEADNAENPEVMHESGIHVYQSSNSSDPLRRLDPSTISNYSTSGGGFGGFGKYSSMAHLSGPTSKMNLSEGEVEFYFYLNGDSDDDFGWWNIALTPNDFVLVKLGSKDGDRVFEMGSTSTSAFSSSSDAGIPAKSLREFEYKELSKGIYRITLASDLEAGEYAFLCPEAMSLLYTFSKP